MRMDLIADTSLSESYVIPVDLVPLIERLSPRRILVEAPLGMKSVALEVARRIGADVSGRNVWGICDIGYADAILLGYDTIVHLAHEISPNVLKNLSANLNCRVEKLGECDLIVIGGVRVLVVPVYYKPVGELVERLATTIGKFDGSVEYSLPFKLYAEEISRRVGAELSPSAITGCYISRRVNKALVVSSGYFHALTIKLFNPSAKVLLADPFRGVVEDVEGVFRRYLALKVDALNKAVRARNIVAVVTTKAGQRPPHVVEAVRRMGLAVVVADEVSPELINNLSVDAVVNTACPRIGFDDLDRVNKPVVNVGEYSVVKSEGLKEYSPSLLLRWHD